MPVGTLIDWWIITRETVFFLFYMLIFSYILLGNRVEVIWAFMLLVLYIVHIFLMKYSAKYEVAIKQALANSMEVKELKRIAYEKIEKFHMNIKTQAVSIEMLNKIKFHIQRVEGLNHTQFYIVLDSSGIRKKLRMPNCVKEGEEKFADRDDKALTARRTWKEAVQQVIVKLQAYKMNLQIQRTYDSRIQKLDKKIYPNICGMDNKIRVEEANSEESFEDFIGESYASSEQLTVVSEDSSDQSMNEQASHME